MFSVYLAGPIMYVSEEDATNWRKNAAALLRAKGINPLDPMRHIYHPGGPKAHASQVVSNDIYDIDKSIGIIAIDLIVPGWGTPMEIFYAFRTRKIVIVVSQTPKEEHSPWVQYHSHLVVPTVEQAVDEMYKATKFGE